MRRKAPTIYRAIITAIGLGLCVSTVSAKDTGEVLQRFADDYALDASRQIATFGIEVDGKWWTVRSREDEQSPVVLTEGRPETPTFYFTLDRPTLDKIVAGELNALTAMGKARSSDPSPMDIDTMEGFDPGDLSLSTLLSVAFHFWTTGTPEIIPFGGEYTRTVHGAQASVFYYQPGFRSAFYQIRPGQHANEKPEDQVNDFPSLLIVLEGGTAKGRIGGREIVLQSGNAILIPAGVTHEFWNDGDRPAEGILLMFGEGA